MWLLSVSQVGLAATSQVVAVRVHDNVLGVWRETAAPRFFVLPAPLTTKFAHSDGKVLDVIGTIGKRMVIVRVPM